MEMKSGRVIAFALISLTLCTGAVFPSKATADTVAVRTQQLLPTNTPDTCVPLSAYGFSAYVYEGELHSFEITVTDNTYVALAGSLGESFIPFNLMTRRLDPSGALRVHVDVESTPLSETVPLTVTLMSAKGIGQPVCISVITMTIGDTPITQAPLVPEIPKTTPVTPATPSSPIGGGAQTSTSGSGTTSTASTGTPAETDGGTSTPSAVSSIKDRILEQCLADGGIRLWVVLLVIYAIIVLTSLFGQLPAPQTFSEGQRAAAIIVPLAFLLAFWYFTESCRVSAWLPLVPIVIALVALMGLYRDNPRVAPYMARMKAGSGTSVKAPEKKKESVIITPPPKGPTS